MTHSSRSFRRSLPVFFLAFATAGLIAPSALADDEHNVIMVGADLGVSAMEESGAFGFNTGVGAVTHAGPAWGLRAGIDFRRWIGLEARYVGMYNGIDSSMTPKGSLGFLTTGGELAVRFTAPLPLIHPYVFAGLGYYKNALSGSADAKAGAVFTSTSQPGVPLGFGFEIPLILHLSIGAEATYHFMIGESFASVTTNGIDGGDITTFNAVVRFRL